MTGAGSGIGQAAAVALAQNGAGVVLVGRNRGKLDATAEQVKSVGGQAVALQVDISRVSDLGVMVDRISEAHDRIDMLVTCAAAEAAAGPAENLLREDWDRLINTDLTGTFLTCQAIGRQMLAQEYGRIVNLASFHVVATYPQRVAYVTAKTAVVGMTQALAVEWGGRGVTVNAVAPGPIRTPRTSWFLSQDPANEAGMIKRTPTGRLGELVDVVAPILFLCSEESRHVTGQTIVVDGGWTKNAWWGDHPWRG